MDIVLSMEKMLYDRLGVGLHSNIDQQALKPMHDGLQPETLVTLEDVGEVDAGQNNETTHIVISWGLLTTIDGNISTIVAHEVPT